jgi:hypothetical protein
MVRMMEGTVFSPSFFGGREAPLSRDDEELLTLREGETTIGWMMPCSLNGSLELF